MASLWRIQRLNAAEYAFLMRLLKLQVMDRKFEVRESLMSINGKKVRSDAETDELLMKQAKVLRPTSDDLSSGLLTLVESNFEVCEKIDRFRRSLRKGVLELLDTLQSRQDRRLTIEGSAIDADEIAGHQRSNEGRRIARVA